MSKHVTCPECTGDMIFGMRYRDYSERWDCPHCNLSIFEEPPVGIQASETMDSLREDREAAWHRAAEIEGYWRHDRDVLAAVTRERDRAVELLSIVTDPTPRDPVIRAGQCDVARDWLAEREAAKEGA